MNIVSRYIKTLCATLAVVLFIACNSEDVGVAGCEDRAITLSYKTRSTSGTGENQFMSGETIWLWATGSTNINAWKLSTDGNGKFTSSTKHYWPKDGTTLQVNALHGNFTTSPTEGSTPWSGSFTHTVLAEQNSEDNYRLSDLLYCSTTIGQWQSSNTLKFEHQLAKVEVTLAASSTNSITEDELSNATVKICSIKPSAIFDTSNGSVTSSGTTIDVTMGKIFSSFKNVREAVVPGQKLSPLIFAVSFNTSGTLRSLTCKTTSDVTLEKGRKYKYTLTLYNDKLSISSVTVENFNEIEKPLSWDIHVGP